MRNGWKRFALPAAALGALLGGALAAGCGAAGIGLGSLGLGLAALAAWALLATASASGCSKTTANPEACLSPIPPADAAATDESAPDVPGWRSCLAYPGACLTPEVVRPCLEAPPPRVGPCLSEPEVCLEVPPEVCLKVAPDPCLSPPVRVCLEYVPPDVCLRVAPHPCLSRPRPVDAGTPDDPPIAPCLDEPFDDGPPVRVCLEEAPHPCLRSSAPDPLSGDPPPLAARDAAERLASSGVLSSEQLRRLARLRGEG